MIKYALRTVAISILLTIIVLSSWLHQSQAKYTIVMSGYHTPSPTPTPTSNCTISFVDGATTRVAGQQCFAQALGTCPAANNPQDPVSFGADPTGVNDSTGAINTALSAGDVVFHTSGRYLIAGVWTGSNHGITLPANAKIEGSVFNSNGTPAVTLFNNTAPSSTNTWGGLLNTTNGGNTICGLDLQGGNAHTGPAPLGSNGDQNLIDINNNNVTVENSTWEYGWGNAAAAINNYGTNIAPSGVLIQYNTAKQNPTYDINTDASNGVTIQNNYAVDGSIGGEFDTCTNTPPNINQHNLYQFNYYQVVNGNCSIATNNQVSCAGVPQGITGDDWPPSCNYASNTVSHNFCIGLSGNAATMGSGFSTPTGSGAHAAYSGNLLRAFCTCVNESAC